MRSLPQSSGKQDYVSRQVEKNLTEVLLKADAGARQVFTGREAIAEEQEKLNLLGFYGQNGKPLREDGILDQDTLLGSNNSPMAKAQREWEKGKPMSVIGPVVFPIPASELTGELWDIVRTDGKAMQEFTNTEDVLRTKMELDTHGYTGPNKEKLTLNNVLDENTLYAWYVRESWEDPSHSFSEEIHDFVKKMEGQDEMEDEVWWAYRQFWAGVVNMVNDPIRLFYNLFMGGDYDPKNAKNEIGRFLRNNLVWQDQVNQAAAESLEQIDDSKMGAKFTKNVLAPLVESLPSIILDFALMAGTAGMSFAAKPALQAAGMVADGAKAAKASSVVGEVAKGLYDDLVYAAAQHVTAARAGLYFVDYTNQFFERGYSVEDAVARGATLAMFSALGDGIGMSAPVVEKTKEEKIIEGVLETADLLIKDKAMDHWIRNLH